jgi:hypothetical protein
MGTVICMIFDSIGRGEPGALRARNTRTLFGDEKWNNGGGWSQRPPGLSDTRTRR